MGGPRALTQAPALLADVCGPAVALSVVPALGAVGEMLSRTGRGLVVLGLCGSIPASCCSSAIGGAAAACGGAAGGATPRRPQRGGSVGREGRGGACQGCGEHPGARSKCSVGAQRRQAYGLSSYWYRPVFSRLFLWKQIKLMLAPTSPHTPPPSNQRKPPSLTFTPASHPAAAGHPRAPPLISHLLPILHPLFFIVCCTTGHPHRTNWRLPPRPRHRLCAT